LPYGYSYKAYPVPDRVKPSFVIVDIWALSYPYDNSERQRVNADEKYNEM